MHAQIIRDGRGQVLALYPLLPDKMQVDRAENGELYYIYSRNSEENPNFKQTGDIILRKDEVLHGKKFVKAWNGIVENRAKYMERWKRDIQGDNPLLAFRAKQMMELTKGKPIKKIDMALVGKVLDHCVVLSKEAYEFYFLDETCVKIV